MISMEDKFRFKKRLMPTAQKIEELKQIPPLICITQAAHESNWGESELTRMACNLFGMTAGPSWREVGGSFFSIQTREYSPLPPDKIKYWNRSGDILNKKADGKGGTILTILADFRKYGNWDESLYDWAKKISTGLRYVKAYEAAKQNLPDTFFHELQQSGYATDPDYGKKLMKVYETVEAMT